jgi:predicted negative regulator of RcsB-dependent stress response
MCIRDRVKDPEKLDVVLGQLAGIFYRKGMIDKAMRVLEYIGNPFHKVMALYEIASIEAEKNREEAMKVLDVAFTLAEKIDDPNARFEVNMKLYDLKHALEGDSVSLMDVLSNGENPPRQD